MAKSKEQTVTVCVQMKYVIGFWDAIKLRLAGKNYQVIAQEI